MGECILAEVKKEYVGRLREMAAIFIEELRKATFEVPHVPGIDAGEAPANWHEATSQAFTVFLPANSVA